MIKPVKDEIFGTRKSILKDKIYSKKLKNSIIFENIWFVTCLRKYNPDKASRYLIIQECTNYKEWEGGSIKSLIPFFKDYIKFMKIFIYNGKIRIKDLKTNKNIEFDYKEEGKKLASKLILRELNCLKGNLIPSAAKIIESEEVSDVSKFLRKEMFGRAASTDIDFIIIDKDSLILVEEKTYLNDNGGSIGHGQYLSFREILIDGLNFKKTVRWYIVFTEDERPNECYYYDFLSEKSNPQRSPSKYNSTRRERRIVIPISEMRKINVDMFINTMIFGTVRK